MKKKSLIIGLFCSAFLLTNCSVNYHDGGKFTAAPTTEPTVQTTTVVATEAITTIAATNTIETKAADELETIDAPEAVNKYLTSKDALSNSHKLGSSQAVINKGINLGERKLLYQFGSLSGNFIVDSFVVSNRGSYKLELHSGQGNFGLELIKEDGSVVFKQDNIGNDHQQLTLEPGTYYVHVLSEGCENSKVLLVRTNR